MQDRSAEHQILMIVWFGLNLTGLELIMAQDKQADGLSSVLLYIVMSHTFKRLLKYLSILFLNIFTPVAFSLLHNPWEVYSTVQSSDKKTVG